MCVGKKTYMFRCDNRATTFRCSSLSLLSLSSFSKLLFSLHSNAVVEQFYGGDRTRLRQRRFPPVRISCTYIAPCIAISRALCIIHAGNIMYPLLKGKRIIPSLSLFTFLCRRRRRPQRFCIRASA